MRNVTIFILSLATLFGLELGLQERERVSFKLPTAERETCPYIDSKDLNLGYVSKAVIGIELGQVPELLLVGDSIIAGDGFEDKSQSLGPRLEQVMTQKGYSLRVRNLAVPGYNLSQQLRLLEKVLDENKHHRPAGVLLTLNAGDADSTFKLTADCRLVDSSTKPHRGRSIAAVLRLESLQRLVFAKIILAINRSSFSDHLGPRLMAALQPRLAERRWQKAIQDLKRIRAIVNERNIPIAVLIFPYSAELTVPIDENPIVRFLVTIVTKAGLESIRLVDRLIDLNTDEAFLDGNALHLSPAAYDQVLPDIVRLVESFNEMGVSPPLPSASGHQ